MFVTKLLGMFGENQSLTSSIGSQPNKVVVVVVAVVVFVAFVVVVAVIDEDDDVVVFVVVSSQKPSIKVWSKSGQ